MVSKVLYKEHRKADLPPAAAENSCASGLCTHELHMALTRASSVPDSGVYCQGKSSLYASMSAARM